MEKAKTSIMEATDDQSLDSDSQTTPRTIASEQKRVVSSSDDGMSTFCQGIIISSLFVFVAATCGVVTYFVLSTSQEDQFQALFESYAAGIADTAKNNATSMFGQFQSLAITITAYGMNSNGTTSFPYVTIPHFGLRSQEIVDLTGAEMIMFVPLVEKSKRRGWENYANENLWWITQDYEYREWNLTGWGETPDKIHVPDWFKDLNDTRGYSHEDGFMDTILANQSYVSEGLTAPISQYGPSPLHSNVSKLDLFAHPIFRKEMVTSLEYDVPVISEPLDLVFLLDSVNHETSKEMRSFALYPVTADFHNGSKIVGYVVAVIRWSVFFANILPETFNGMMVEIQSDCGSNFTYILNEDSVEVPTKWEVIRERDDSLDYRTTFFDKGHPTGESKQCHFDLVIYPSKALESVYVTSSPFMFGAVVVLAFFLTGGVFCVLKMFMSRKQKEAQDKADRAEAIVASVFPKAIGDRLIAEAAEKNGFGGSRGQSTAGLLQDFLATGEGDRKRQSKPIADLFPNTTVLFADIVGFTAWSSTREPTQVFILLETLYRNFDRIAQKRGVYKVETVGDCYVAVAGLPEPRKDHCTIIARFASDILTRTGVLTCQLESELGPDTAELGIRIGIHSGPVTAGVLRGERARFQLFGDTVNVAARIESHGKKNRIHISKETASLLEAAGKAHWVSPREDKIVAKGKGEMATFWLNMTKVEDPQSSSSGRSSGPFTTDSVDLNHRPSVAFMEQALHDERSPNEPRLTKKMERLIDWNVDVLVHLLERIERSRLSGKTVPDPSETLAEMEKQIREGHAHSTVIDEVVEMVELPHYQSGGDIPEGQINLRPEVLTQLREYVLTIALMYNENSFHNFEHASHVTMSVTKLLGRIVASDVEADNHEQLHDFSYGLTSDPLTQFAVVFSAMLHDVDHPGVPNAQLVKEKAETASLYKDKSVAEQNSIDLTWDLLLDDQYLELRRAIYCTTAELQRFRKIVVNTVLATDIMDKELTKLRNDRWAKAFSFDDDVSVLKMSKTQSDLKAMIVIEHLMQASDVAHTMQHWHVYCKWNAKLFKEMYQAYVAGRSEKDPAEFWYQGEIGFFDFYVIPLAKKLKECGVFGVSSEEYLNYAEQNRKEWESKGKQMVEELKEMVGKQ